MIEQLPTATDRSSAVNSHADNLRANNDPAADSRLAAYEAQLRAMPSYELKAEYITELGKSWDQLPRPKLEHAILALVQRARAAT